jgi:RNA polymerase sigma factor (sigma-70 family)
MTSAVLPGRASSHSPHVPPPDDESEVLALVAAGDRDGALRRLMDVHGEALYRFCSQMVGDQVPVDDLHQTIFLDAHRDLRRFSGRSSVKAWLYAIARHRCLDALKGRRRWLRRFQLGTVLPEVHSDVASPEEQLVARSGRVGLERCLGELAVQSRMAVLLRFQQELEYPEMAALSGEKAATLQMRVARALPVLRQCLERGGEAR